MSLTKTLITASATSSNSSRSGLLVSAETSRGSGGVKSNGISSNMTNTSATKSSGSENEDTCPVCKNSRYLSPNMVLYVSECYHKMCEGCVNRTFANGAPTCLQCGRAVKRINFKLPTFGDLLVEKEVTQRKWVASQILKRREDFDTLRDFNDYEEIIEDFALAEEHQLKLAQKNDAIDILATFKGDVKALLAEQKAANDRRKLLSNSPSLQIPILQSIDSGVGVYSNEQEVTDDFPMELDPINSPYEDVRLYTHKEKYSDTYTEINDKLKAGGFSIKFVHERALQAAFSGLFLAPLTVKDEDGDVLMS
ncbi:1907_t:CDS:2 [Ambispora gerdemannii]|uniref:1907_t:CDS:1 n=1 Tax=Ambispora gerdemannii TaxID=144530 RepID=A0A9N8VF62_9GLOM|nr:1907_t:CDS:2 [Ambispora gerdemannii]